MSAFELTTAISKSFGLFYLFGFFIAVLVYAYWPRNRERFEAAARSVINEDDRPCR